MCSRLLDRLPERAPPDRGRRRTSRRARRVAGARSSRERYIERTARLKGEAQETLRDSSVRPVTTVARQKSTPGPRAAQRSRDAVLLTVTKSKLRRHHVRSIVAGRALRQARSRRSPHHADRLRSNAGGRAQHALERPSGRLGHPRRPSRAAPGGAAAAATPRAVGWGAPSPQAGWTPLPGGGWRPPQGSDATFIAPPRQERTTRRCRPTTARCPTTDPARTRRGASIAWRESARPRCWSSRARFWASPSVTTSGSRTPLRRRRRSRPAAPARAPRVARSSATAAPARAARRSATASGSGSSPVRQRRRLVVDRLVVGRLVELRVRCAEQPKRDRRGGRPRPGRHQRHAGLPVRPGGGHGHRPQLVGPRAHQQPRGRRRDRHQRHRHRQRQDLHSHRARLRSQPRHRPHPAAERLGPEVGADRRLLQDLGRRRGRRSG